MAWSLAHQTNYLSSATANIHTCTLGTAATGGNLLVATFVMDALLHATAPVFYNGSNANTLTAITTATGNTLTGMYYIIVPGGGITSVSVQLTGTTAAPGAITCLEYTGNDASTTFDRNAAFNGTTNSPAVTTTLAPSVTGELVVAVFGKDQGTAYTNNSITNSAAATQTLTWAQLQNATTTVTGTKDTIYVAHALTSDTSGTVGAKITDGASDVQAAVIATFKPAAGGAAASPPPLGTVVLQAVKRAGYF